MMLTAESTELGVLPNISQIHADAALNAMKDCGLSPKDIDGIVLITHGESGKSRVGSGPKRCASLQQCYAKATRAATKEKSVQVSHRRVPTHRRGS